MIGKYPDTLFPYKNEPEEINYSPLMIDKNNIQIDPSLVIPALQSIAEEVKCPICLNLVFEPKECKSCAHVFCGNCLDNWNKKGPVGNGLIGRSTIILGAHHPNNSMNQPYAYNPYIVVNSRSYDSQFERKLCPMKCQKFEESIISLKFRNMINKIKINCPNHSKGCNSIINYEDITQHLSSCQYREFICNGATCGYRGTLQELQIHTQVCALIAVKCPDCGYKIIRANLEDHKEDCLYKKIMCRFCKSEFQFAKINEHKDQCILNIIKFYESKMEPSGKIFKNVLTSTTLQFTKEVLKNINSSIIERIGLNEFHLIQVSNTNSNITDVVTIIELDKEINFSNFEIIVNTIWIKGEHLNLKFFSSQEGTNWTENGNTKLLPQNLNDHVRKIQVNVSKCKIFLIGGDKPFKINYFKILDSI